MSHLPESLPEYEPAAVLPPAPMTVRETGLDQMFLVELLSKILFSQGLLALSRLADISKLSLAVLQEVLGFMRVQQLCEVRGRGDSEASASYQLTEQGRERAQGYLQRCRYAGPAPVTLEAYQVQMLRHSVADMPVTRERVARGFEGFVVRQSILDSFGAAMNSGRAIFVYGPAGSGKTYLSEHLVSLLWGVCLVPHALQVEGEVIQLFDPLVHTPKEHDERGFTPLDRGAPGDQRWVTCRRPVVLTGGELTLAMLDLQFDAQSRFYQAPPQVKANNGLLIIDDLGRQLLSPQALMNRWIVPLDRRVDYLALHTGSKFLVPFDVVVVFSSNLPPAELADEAFLRRLGYKIHIGPLREEEYRAIFEQTCARFGIPFSVPAFRYLVDVLHPRHEKPLLACYPRDLLQQVRDFSFYKGIPPALSEDALSLAWDNYFARA